MKKILIALLAASMLFAFTACEDDSSSSPDNIDAATVKSYFQSFATDHIFNEINELLTTETDTDEMANLDFSVSEDVKTITASFDATSLRFNGKADGTDARTANGRITVVINGSVSDTTFTATGWEFKGNDLDLTDVSTSQDKLPSITVDVNLKGEFTTAPEFDIASMTISNPTAVAFNWLTADGTITVQPNNVSFAVTDII